MAAHEIEDTWTADDEDDPDAVAPSSRKLVTQPYDLTVGTLLSQIEDNTLHLKPLSGRPKMQRRYVWPDRLASRLVESMLINVPIPPCYFAQDEDFEHEVIDGQQRLYSLYRYTDNQFKLSHLETLSELNGLRYHQLPSQLQNRLKSYVLRCIAITNDSDEELRFDVFERLNSNTMPLNAQELRNCVYHGDMIDLLGELATNSSWLEVLRRKSADKRMRDEELILRFFAFRHLGLESYRTPQKFWLNSMAKQYREPGEAEIENMRTVWLNGLSNARALFDIPECFRRPNDSNRVPPVNKALVDLNMLTLSAISPDQAANVREQYRQIHADLLQTDEFNDLISRAVDHKKRTERRFEMWNDAMAPLNVPSVG